MIQVTGAIIYVLFLLVAGGLVLATTMAKKNEEIKTILEEDKATHENVFQKVEEYRNDFDDAGTAS